MKRTTIMNHFTQVSLHVLSRSGDLLGAFHRQQVEEIPFAKRVFVHWIKKKKKDFVFKYRFLYVADIEQDPPGYQNSKVRIFILKYSIDFIPILEKRIFMGDC